MGVGYFGNLKREEKKYLKQQASIKIIDCHQLRFRNRQETLEYQTGIPRVSNIIKYKTSILSK